MRLDEYLVLKKDIKSRNLAKQYIEKGFIKVNGKTILKPSFQINENNLIDIDILDEFKYVSRAGYKLEAAINAFKIKCLNKIVLDIGASTGGFSDCCLQNGAKKIYCVDVGWKQLDEKLLNDNRVINLENTNIKDLDKKLINEPIDLIVSDLSFISSKYMFWAVEKLNLKNPVNLITLIKPQFELDQKILKLSHHSIKDKKYLNMAIDNVKSYAEQYNWKIMGIIPSPILGAKKENQEFLLWCIKHE